MVGPLGGGLSGRHPPQAQQGHHVVDAQGLQERMLARNRSTMGW